MKKIVSIVLLSVISCGLHSQSVNEYNPAVKEIIVICKTHFDIGYTHRVNDIVNFYRTTMIDNALKAIDGSHELPDNQQFAWTLPGWVAYKTMEDWPGQTKERRDKLNEAMLSGKILTHALPFTMESDACELEELARGMIFSSRLNRKYNLPLPRSGKQTDVPSHGGAVATVLANGDVKFVHLGNNYPSGYVQVPPLFWWEGPDGSRVLTLYSPIYGTTVSAFYANGWKGPDGMMVGKNLLPPKDWSHKVWPAILVTGDNVGAPTAGQIKKLIDEVHEKMPGVTVRMGTLDDFYYALMEEKPVLPVIKGEMPDTWIHGIMCDPGGIKLSRETHPLLASTEVLNTQLACWGQQTPSNEQDIEKAYENILLYGEHTWGRSSKVNKYGEAFKQIPSKEYADLEASWEEKTDYIRKANRITHEINQSNMDLLAKSVKQKDGSFIVYNSLPWSRSGIVEVNGKTIFVENIPPCGYRVVRDKETEQTKLSTSEVIENDFFRIDFDVQKGRIKSFYDKRNRSEWVDNSAEFGLGQYMNERFTYEQTVKYASSYQQKGSGLHTGLYKPNMISEQKVPYRAASPENGKLTVKVDKNKQTAELVMPGSSSGHLPGTTLRVTLFAKEPYVDMELTIHDKAKDNWPEADWLCLPFKIDNPEFRVYRPLGVMNPVTDILPGSNRHLYTVGNGVTITGTDGAGIAVCPIDHPLISLDTPGCWQFSTDFVPKKPVIYLNLYNNQWNTNFRYWYPGTWSSRVRLWAIGKGTSEEDRNAIFTCQTLEARNPLQGIAGKSSNGNLPAQQSGIKSSRTGIIITAFGSDPDGNKGTLLRVWEQAGKSGEITLTLPDGLNVTEAVPVNLRGETKGEPLTVKSGKIHFSLGKYAPASFILK